MNTNEENLNPLKGDILNEFNIEDMPQATFTGHMWRQEGTQLICQSCTFKHSTFIQPGYQLYGIDKDGIPQIRRILIDEAATPKNGPNSPT